MKKYLTLISVFILVLVSFFAFTGCKKEVSKNSERNDILIQTTEERGIRLTRRNVRNDDGSYTITATVTPEDATNKSLTWTLDCNDETWIDGHDPEDYVQITISSDTLSCNVKLLQKFSVQLKLVVTSQADSSITATCTIDCYKNIVFNSIDVDALYDYSCTDQVLVLEYDDNNFIDCSGLTYEDFISGKLGINICSAIDYEFGTGTVEPTDISVSVAAAFHEDLISSYNILTATTNQISTEYEILTYESDNIIKFENLHDLCYYSGALDSALMSTSNLFRFKVTIIAKVDNVVVSSCTEEFVLGGFDLGQTPVTNVSLSDSNIIL